MMLLMFFYLQEDKAEDDKNDFLQDNGAWFLRVITFKHTLINTN